MGLSCCHVVILPCSWLTVSAVWCAQIGINCAVFTAQGAYPTVDGINEARGMAKRIGAGSIVGIGGGGTVDTAKGVARLYSSR